ncbi:TWiK family of potassium channels protein 7-like [Tubulanus polymorphus]|uniref:TWiK family of potassium channels protein 7-like n=1 Tax=Tubulanus polymorphus TaxID=672921 RepID=UPI003DA55932
MSNSVHNRNLDRMEKQPPPTMPPPDVAVTDTGKEQKRKKCIGVCKKFLKFLFSHVGLFLMVCLYSVMGGFIFEHLEKTNEKSECFNKYDKYVIQENDTTNRLYDITQQGNDEYDTKVSMVKVLQRFRHNVVALDLDVNCSLLGEPGGISNKWSWAGSLMFSVTVVSTIGYGHIAPKTTWGKVVCMAYAVLGIPLLLLFLAMIGDVLADLFKLIYSRVCCCGCFRKRTEKTKVESVEQNPPPQPAWRTENSGKPTPPPKTGPVVIEDDEDDEDDEFDDDNITIPLTVTMLVITAYIVFGAVLFSIWEEWNMLDSSYFCFITISTIGFGDFVPGTEDLESTKTHIQLIMGAIYMIFGMAILSMCFSLIQDEIAAKFKWLGQKIGLVDKQTTETDAEAA